MAASAHRWCHTKAAYTLFTGLELFLLMIFMGEDEMQCEPAVTVFIVQLSYREHTRTHPIDRSS